MQHHFGDSEGHRRKVDGAGTPGTTLAQASILSEVSDPLRDATHSGGWIHLAPSCIHSFSASPHSLVPRLAPL